MFNSKGENNTEFRGHFNLKAHTEEECPSNLTGDLYKENNGGIATCRFTLDNHVTPEGTYLIGSMFKVIALESVQEENSHQVFKSTEPLSFLPKQSCRIENCVIYEACCNIEL